MGLAIGFLVGGMLGRIAGPIAQDWFEYKTQLGREMAQRKLSAQLAKQRVLNQIDFENKVRFSEIEHQRKLDDMQKQFALNRKNAEAQMLLAYSDWQQKVFWEKCYPLRNPYEMPLGYKPVYNEKNEIEKCELSTLLLPNGKQVVPLRVITALKDNIHPHAVTVNGNLSMFLAANYSTNGEHAVWSDIGAWKDESPVNDASLNYLFKGLKGQPAMVLVPTYTNGGTIVRLKICSWGLGEENNGIPLQYPIGFDFGWFDLEAIYRRALANEVKNFSETLAKIGAKPTSRELEHDIKILSMIESKKDILQKDDVERLLSLLSTPNEINDSLRRCTNEIASTIYCCAIGMYADGYHLFEYGTMPLLPNLLTSMTGIKYIAPFIRDYYMSLANTAVIKNILSPSQAISIEIVLAKSMKQIGCTSKTYEELIDDIRKHNHNTEGEFHKTVITELCELKSNINLKKN